MEADGWLLEETGIVAGVSRLGVLWWQLQKPLWRMAERVDRAQPTAAAWSSGGGNWCRCVGLGEILLH